MENVNILIELLNQYLSQAVEPKNIIEIFIDYIIPAVSFISIVVTGVFSYIKYRESKNIEIYEKVLNSVYSPLYEYFVRQETFSNIHLPERIISDSPILEVESKKTTTKYTNGQGLKTSVEINNPINLTRNEFLKMKENVNVGLASVELLTLLNMYEVYIYMENTYDKNTDEYLKASSYKVAVENALREEIISGYIKYSKKICVSKNIKTDLFKLEKNNVVINSTISKEVLENLRKPKIKIDKAE
jgi:hypothetical protein